MFYMSKVRLSRTTDENPVLSDRSTLAHIIDGP